MKSFSGIILSAGFGTRLHPFTENCPKPLVPVLNKTPLWHQIMLIWELGLKDIYVNLHFLAEVVKSYLKKNFDFVKYTYESEILGTGGGIKNIINSFKIEEPLIVLNGDTISNINLEGMIDFHIRNTSDATMLLIEDRDIPDQNSVFIDKNYRIRYIKSQPKKPDMFKRCRFLGLHIINPSVFKYLPVNGCINQITYPSLISKNYKVYGYLTRIESFDIGTPESLYRTNFMLKNSKITSPIFDKKYLKKYLDPNGNILGENVKIVNSRVFNSIIGDNSIIVDSKISDSLIFSDSKIKDKILKRCVANTKYKYIIPKS
ncbi:MAG: sugar phosphate nucleotidyltransferase [Myxococcota bacterium]